jgi:membrane-associated phospholipid phosphatase
MAVSEWVVSVYFAALTLAAWQLPVGPARRLHASALGVAVLITTVGAGLFAPYLVRAWAPIAYLIAGYWMPALLVTRGKDARFEEWLVRTDRQLRRFLPAVPRSLGHVVELGYLLCYPLVPLSFAVVWLTGDTADVERFWLAVLLSGYACYVTLPWLVSRPPRLQRDQGPRRSVVAQVNARVLGRVSHSLNTFPSGHVAVAAAAAASVASVSVPAGAVLAGVVAAISVGAAAGGYHYVIDVIFGFAVAAAAVVVSGLI